MSGRVISPPTPLASNLQMKYLYFAVHGLEAGTESPPLPVFDVGQTQGPLPAGEVLKPAGHGAVA